MVIQSFDLIAQSAGRASDPAGVFVPCRVANAVLVNDAGIGHSRLVEKTLHPVQVNAWRRMTPDAKWDLVLSANRMLRNAVRDRIVRHHGSWTMEEVEEETNRTLLRART
jgi:hypothetical protein